MIVTQHDRLNQTGGHETTIDTLAVSEKPSAMKKYLVDSDEIKQQNPEQI